MTDYTKTLTDTLRVHGPQPTSKWGTMLWGENWGIGTELQTDVDKGALSGTITLDDSYTRSISLATLTGTISLSGALNDLNLADSNGYSYVFTYPTNDSEDRANTTYTKASTQGTSWTEGSEAGTSWSDA